MYLKPIQTHEMSANKSRICIECKLSVLSSQIGWFLKHLLYPVFKYLLYKLKAEQNNTYFSSARLVFMFPNSNSQIFQIKIKVIKSYTAYKLDN